MPHLKITIADSAIQAGCGPTYDDFNASMMDRCGDNHLEAIMRSLVPVAVLSCALAALPAVGFAQSIGAGDTPHAAPLTWSAARAETDVQLMQMTRAGYRATTAGNQNYPLAMQRALARVNNPMPDRWRDEKAAMEARAARDAQTGHPVKAFFVKTAYYLKGENTF
ncbi:hypothetical protein NUV28_11425 [Burkholderia cenocepacia]|nr:hypothetical protein [Burkholderia cenocepacia]